MRVVAVVPQERADEPTGQPDLDKLIDGEA
jgi:hypothetical protein